MTANNWKVINKITWIETSFLAEFLADLQAHSPYDKRKNKHDGSRLVTNLLIFHKSICLSSGTEIRKNWLIIDHPKLF